MSIARKGEDLGMTKAPDNNADTVALFGSSASYIQPLQLLTDRVVVSKMMNDPTNPT
jgi:hypothetical protein